MTAHAIGVADLLTDLERQLDGFLRSIAGESHERGLVSLTLPAPRIPIRRMPAVDEGALFWARPEDGCVRLGLGHAIRYVASGAGRIERLNAMLGKLTKQWRQHDPHRTGLAPGVFTGFAFDPLDPMRSRWAGFPNALLTVPSMLYESRGDTCAITFTGDAVRAATDARQLCREWVTCAATLLDGTRTVRGAGASLPPPRIVSSLDRRVWEGRVAEAIEAIRSGEFDKVVLSRRARVEGRGIGISPEALEGLAGPNPGRVQFAVTMRGATLFGSSPEHLVSLHDSVAWSDAVAGTRLFPAETGAEDRVSAFSRDEKSRHEQALVVDAIAVALRSRCQNVRYAREPSVVRFSRMGHLWTRIEGEPRDGVSLLELASVLHPTPAVGGSPTEPAIEWLDRHGEELRGWYTGAIGWIDPAGSGTLSVVLRCALVRGHAADIFAGAGIVEGSDPGAEYEETEWKLHSMLEVLGIPDSESEKSAY
ncbi:MAG: isochorismate synthase [Pseudomonadota bacterium]|nr:isochorismate synthase [Pseudomonadota bacterium]